MEVEVTEEDTVSVSLFAWCYQNKHQECKRSYRKFLIDPRTNKIEWLKQVVHCACKKRGCKCYIKPADRPKPVKKRATRRKK